MDNLRMLSMAPCVKNLKIPKNTICKLENKQRNERQKKERMDYWRHMPTNHFLCICIFKKKEGGCWGSVLIGICVYVFVRKKGERKKRFVGDLS